MPAKILVVDDAPLNRRILTSLLQPEGSVLLEAGNGREAIDLALRALPVSKYFTLSYLVLDCRYRRLAIVVQRILHLCCCVRAVRWSSYGREERLLA